jgi:hypothetical protein
LERKRRKRRRIPCPKVPPSKKAGMVRRMWKKETRSGRARSGWWTEDDKQKPR